MPADRSRFDPSALKLRASAAADTPDHFVELYEDEASLVASLTRFIGSGVAEGEAAVVIAQPCRRAALDAAIAGSPTLRAAADRGRVVSLDAAETLALFMDGAMPNPARFERVIGEVIMSVARPNGKVRAFGEMVAILWDAGNVQAAIALEDLWNDFIARHGVTLFCAYPVDRDGVMDARLVAVCERHSHVLVPPAHGHAS